MRSALIHPLQLDLNSLVGAEDDGGSQASDGLIVFGVHIGENSVFALV